MKTSIRLSLAALLSLFWTIPASAEIYNCEGRWTNKPCDSNSRPAFAEEQSAPDPDAETKADLSKRKLWLQDLDLLRLRLKRKHDVAVSTREIEELCLNTNSSAIECSQAVSAKENEINQLLVEKDRLNVERDRNKIEEKTAEQNANPPTAVTVIQENNVIIAPRHHDRPHHVRDFPQVGPIPQPENSSPPTNSNNSSTPKKKLGAGVLMPN